MENVIKFYIAANNLKNAVRTGWTEVEISSDRIESVAEHIYGSLILTIGLDSEYKLDLDILKTFKMIIVKQLEKVVLKETTVRDYPSAEERKAQALKTVKKVTEGLSKQDELLSLLDEANKYESKEAK